MDRPHSRPHPTTLTRGHKIDTLTTRSGVIMQLIDTLKISDNKRDALLNVHRTITKTRRKTTRTPINHALTARQTIRKLMDDTRLIALRRTPRSRQLPQQTKPRVKITASRMHLKRPRR